MSSRHRIHLKGPWVIERLSLVPNDAESSTAKKQERVTMPIAWGDAFGAVSGRVRFRRAFHCPTNLADSDVVWIVFDGVGGHGIVSVNGSEIGTLKSSRSLQQFEMTPLLKPFSELVVDLEYAWDESASIPGGLFAPVAIEIDSDS